MFKNEGAEACLMPHVVHGELMHALKDMEISSAANVWVYASDDQYLRFKWAKGTGLDAALNVPGASSIEVLDRRRDNLVSVQDAGTMMFVGFSLPDGENARAVELFSVHDAFTFGAVGDDDDAMWQGEDQPTKFELDGLEVPDLPRVVGRRGDERLDVSGNVGRWFDTFGARLWAGSRMWFGKAFDPVISLDRVRSLPVGEVSDGPNGGVRVRLFEPGDSLEVVRERQRAVVEWLGFRRLEKHAEQIKAAYPDRFSG